ncbi:MAG: hypothetical protein ACJ76Z_03910 [Thermoleophilaceae bacterium]
MTEHRLDMEQLLRLALTPVEPSNTLAERLDVRLTDLTAAAADELADWELTAMRDPRNWARPAAAVVIGGTAAAALILVRAQRRSKREGHPFEALEQGALDVSREIRKRLKR